jgi:hypothetical protein
MSTDATVVCDKCKTYRHLGQEMALIPSFGYGSNDTDGRLLSAEYVFAHLWHNKEGLRIVRTDDIPDGYVDDLGVAKEDQFVDKLKSELEAITTKEQAATWLAKEAHSDTRDSYDVACYWEDVWGNDQVPSADDFLKNKDLCRDYLRSLIEDNECETVSERTYNDVVIHVRKLLCS